MRIGRIVREIEALPDEDTDTTVLPDEGRTMAPPPDREPVPEKERPDQPVTP